MWYSGAVRIARVSSFAVRRRARAGTPTRTESAGASFVTTAFAPRGTRVVELGDAERNPHEPIGLQRVIDRLGEHPHAFLAGGLTVDEIDREIRSIDA